MVMLSIGACFVELVHHGSSGTLSSSVENLLGRGGWKWDIPLRVG